MNMIDDADNIANKNVKVYVIKINLRILLIQDIINLTHTIHLIFLKFS